MKLNYLDILEQCFRNKIFGYNKEDVDTFLHLIAEDFKELYEELELLKIEIAKNVLSRSPFSLSFALPALP